MPTKADLNPLIAALDRERERQGLTLYALAQRAEMSQIAVTRILRGDVLPRIDTLQRLTSSLGKKIKISD